MEPFDEGPLLCLNLTLVDGTENYTEPSYVCVNAPIPPHLPEGFQLPGRKSMVRPIPEGGHLSSHVYGRDKYSHRDSAFSGAVPK